MKVKMRGLQRVFFIGMEPNPGKPDRSEVVRVMWGFL